MRKLPIRQLGLNQHARIAAIQAEGELGRRIRDMALRALVGGKRRDEHRRRT